MDGDDGHSVIAPQMYLVMADPAMHDTESDTDNYPRLEINGKTFSGKIPRKHRDWRTLPTLTSIPPTTVLHKRKTSSAPLPSGAPALPILDSAFTHSPITSIANTNSQFYDSVSYLFDSIQYPVSIHDPAFNPLPLSLLPIDPSIPANTDTINVFSLAAGHALRNYQNTNNTTHTEPVTLSDHWSKTYDQHIAPTDSKYHARIENEISSLIMAPISIQQSGKAVLRIHGVVDTAAQLPVLSESFCRSNSIDLFPITNENLITSYFDGKIQLARWQTELLTVRYAPNRIEQSVFLVLENSTQQNCLIGGNLRHRLGLDDMTNIASTWMDDRTTSAMIAAVHVPIHGIGPILSQPRSNKTTDAHTSETYSDDDFIYQDWTDVPTSSPFDLPLSYSGVAPTRQHVVNHANSTHGAAEIASRLPAIIEALNQNNVITAAPSFIADPDATVHLAHTDGTKPKYIPQPRNMPERKRVAVRLQIAKWMRNGKIRFLRPDERHLWNSQLLTAPKPGSFEEDGTQKLRICFNGKSSVNIGLLNDEFTLPSIANVLNKCVGASFFTELDCEDAYLQLILDAESQPITAFEFESKSYCFVGAPYGITFIGNTFQRVMQKNFQDMPFVQVYIDNIWIISPDNYDTHYNHVMAVIARCNERKLRLNLKKPVLFKREFVGFGHHISSAGVSLDPKKREAAMSWDPESLKLVRCYPHF